MSPEFKCYLDYIKPYVDLALAGKYNGHNMNRGFYESMKGKDLPIVFNDSVYSILKVIAGCTSGYRKSDKTKQALNFMYDQQDSFQAGHLWADETGLLACLYWSLKTIETYLLK